MKFKTRLLMIMSLILIIGFNSQKVSAQRVDYKNKVEFLENEVTDDLSAIKVTSEELKTVSTSKVEQKEETRNIVTFSDLANVLEKRRMRFRNVRAHDKCYRDSEENCNTEE